MSSNDKALRHGFCLVLIALCAVWLTACATKPAAPTANIETLPQAISVPYRLSSSGRFIIDIAVNNEPPRPFVIDTGATISAIYDQYSGAMEIAPISQSVLVRGLVSVGKRPIIKDVEFKIGSKPFKLDHIAVLETPDITDEATGLLGTDILADYTALFNKDTMIATIVPSTYVHPRSFSGWRKISLENQIDSASNDGLYFTHIKLDKKDIPVLIDTGANLNFMNWQLATLDKDIERLQRNLRNEGKLQGALETTSLEMSTIFYDLVLGNHYWPSVPVTVLGLDTLAVVAPVDQPMMIAGASMFTPSTVAFDLGGQKLYIRPNPDDQRPPSRLLNK